MNSGLIALKELALLLKMSEATVNYYTNLGLFQTADRQGNKRLYDQVVTAARLDRIRDLRRQGYSLMLIQQKFLAESLPREEDNVR